MKLILIFLYLLVFDVAHATELPSVGASAPQEIPMWGWGIMIVLGLVIGFLVLKHKNPAEAARIETSLRTALAETQTALGHAKDVAKSAMDLAKQHATTIEKIALTVPPGSTPPIDKPAISAPVDDFSLPTRYK